MKNELLVVLPFYGELPWYFRYYLESVRNRKFSILFVSDLVVSDVPSNFKQLKLSFQELCELICEKIPGAVPLKNTRKLCDYKPMYGRIFEEWLKDYAYWGYGDCDMVFGADMDDFVAKIVSNRFDIASMRKHWVSGPFTMLKNNSRMINLYAESRDVRNVFRSDDCINFDELGGQWFNNLINGSMTMKDCERQLDYFTTLIWRQTDLKFYHEDDLCEINLSEGSVMLKDDVLRDPIGKRIPAFHFINAKHLGYFGTISDSSNDLKICYYTPVGVCHSAMECRVSYVKWFLLRARNKLRRLVHA